MAQVPEPTDGKLWVGSYGTIRLDALEPRIVIARCSASVGDLSYRVRGGGTRIAGTRPLTPEKAVIEAQKGFFQGLKESIAREGVKLPVLIWEINGKAYLRYGASRVYACRTLGLAEIPCVVAAYSDAPLRGYKVDGECNTPLEVLGAFRYPRIVGSFEVSHEMIDAHRLEP